MKDVTAARRYTPSPLDDGFMEGWRSLAWGVVILGALGLGFAGVIAYSAASEMATESGGDDSLAPLGLIIAATIAGPSAVALTLGGLSFVRRWGPNPRKVLACLGAATLAIEILVVGYGFY